MLLFLAFAVVAPNSAGVAFGSENDFPSIFHILFPSSHKTVTRKKSSGSASNTAAGVAVQSRPTNVRLVPVAGTAGATQLTPAASISPVRQPGLNELRQPYVPQPLAHGRGLTPMSSLPSMSNAQPVITPGLRAFVRSSAVPQANRSQQIPTYGPRVFQQAGNTPTVALPRAAGAGGSLQPSLRQPRPVTVHEIVLPRPGTVLTPSNIR